MIGYELHTGVNQVVEGSVYIVRNLHSKLEKKKLRRGRENKRTGVRYWS